MEQQFQEWIEEYQARIWSVCRFYAWDPEERKDLYQEILYQIWKALPRFRGESSPGTWVYRIAVNSALMFRRTAGRRKDTESLSLVPEALSADNIEASLERKEQEHILKTAISRLKDIDQTIVLLHFEELSYQDISEITGLSVSNVGARLSRIRQQLKKQLTPSS